MAETKFTLKLCEGEYCRDITDRLNLALCEIVLFNGHIHVQQEHTTCAVTLNENESGLKADLLRRLDEIAPISNAQYIKGGLNYYFHDDMTKRTENIEKDTEERRNGHAHVRAMLIDKSPLVLRVRNMQVHLGRWQRVLFFDFDDIGPRRERTVSVSVVSDMRGAA